MEAIVLILALCVLGILANRCGVDSRDGPRSKEQEFAEFGCEWGEPLHEAGYGGTCQRAQEHRPTLLPEAA